LGHGDAVPDGWACEFEAGGLLAGFGVHGPHLGTAAAFEGFVLFVEFLEDGRGYGGEAFEGVFFVDDIALGRNELESLIV
jgi:hypothetical protein